MIDGHWSTLLITVIVVILPLKLWYLLVKFFFFFFTISLEKCVLKPLGYRHKIPRNPKEVLRTPHTIWSLMKKEAVVSKNSKLLEVEALQGIETEPDKNRTSISLLLVYTSEEGKRHELKVFAKFQTGKGMPLWLQAIRAAAEPNVAREIDFYNILAQEVPIETPRKYVASKLTVFNLVFLVIEYFDVRNTFEVIPDHRFASISKLSTILCELSKMHAKYFSRTNELKSTRWIPAKEGLKFCEWIRTLGMKNESKEYAELYKAIEQYFKDRPVTLIHGDCRPGNMIFRRDDDSYVLFTDWEAVNIGPPAWDFTYATVLGLPPQLRKSKQEFLLQAYTASLLQAMERDGTKPLQTYEQLQKDVMVLTIVLFYLSKSVTKIQAWDQQGNTTQDVQNWRKRVGLALLDIDTVKVAELINFPHDSLQSALEVAQYYNPQGDDQIQASSL